jgi:hypothetical protein
VPDSYAPDPSYDQKRLSPQLSAPKISTLPAPHSAPNLNTQFHNDRQSYHGGARSSTNTNIRYHYVDERGAHDTLHQQSRQARSYPASPSFGPEQHGPHDVRDVGCSYRPRGPASSVTVSMVGAVTHTSGHHSSSRPQSSKQAILRKQSGKQSAKHPQTILRPQSSKLRKHKRVVLEEDEFESDEFVLDLDNGFWENGFLENGLEHLDAEFVVGDEEQRLRGVTVRGEEQRDEEQRYFHDDGAAESARFQLQHHRQILPQHYQNAWDQDFERFGEALEQAPQRETYGDRYGSHGSNSARETYGDYDTHELVRVNEVLVPRRVKTRVRERPRSAKTEIENRGAATIITQVKQRPRSAKTSVDNRAASTVVTQVRQTEQRMSRIEKLNEGVLYDRYHNQGVDRYHNQGPKARRPNSRHNEVVGQIEGNSGSPVIVREPKLASAGTNRADLKRVTFNLANHLHIQSSRMRERTEAGGAAETTTEKSELSAKRLELKVEKAEADSSSTSISKASVSESPSTTTVGDVHTKCSASMRTASEVDDRGGEERASCGAEREERGEEISGEAADEGVEVIATQVPTHGPPHVDEGIEDHGVEENSLGVYEDDEDYDGCYEEIGVYEDNEEYDDNELEAIIEDATLGVYQDTDCDASDSEFIMDDATVGVYQDTDGLDGSYSGSYTQRTVGVYRSTGGRSASAANANTNSNAKSHDEVPDGEAHGGTGLLQSLKHIAEQQCRPETQPHRPRNVRRARSGSYDKNGSVFAVNPAGRSGNAGKTYVGLKVSDQNGAKGVFENLRSLKVES